MKLAERLVQGPVLSVRADQSIADSVELMRQHSVGALLVVSDDVHTELLGIFTERDLLQRVNLIHDTGAWGKAIRTVMTKNPRTVTLAKLHEAPALMVRLGVRHIPIVETVQGKKRAVGVVSMRDCFDFLFESGAAEGAFQLLPSRFDSKKQLPPLGLVAKSKGIRELIQSSLGKELAIEHVDTALHMGKGTVVPDLRKLSAIVIDIDGENPNTWVALLKRLHQPELPPVVVCFDPSSHSEMEGVLLQRLRASNHFHVFRKPIHLMPFIALLSKLLTKKTPK